MALRLLKQQDTVAQPVTRSQNGRPGYYARAECISAQVAEILADLSGVMVSVTPVTNYGPSISSARLDPAWRRFGRIAEPTGRTLSRDAGVTIAGPHGRARFAPAITLPLVYSRLPLMRIGGEILG